MFFFNTRIIKLPCELVSGPLVEELHVNINEWISQVVRVYNGQDRIEFNWLVGPINIT